MSEEINIYDSEGGFSEDRSGIFYRISDVDPVIEKLEAEKTVLKLKIGQLENDTVKSLRDEISHLKSERMPKKQLFDFIERESDPHAEMEPLTEGYLDCLTGLRYFVENYNEEE